MKFLTKYTAAVLFIFCLVPQTADATRLLIPVGEVIGLELTDDTVTVADFDESLGKAAQRAGLQTGDKIIKIDNQNIFSADDIRSALDKCNGTLTVTVMRNGKQKNLRLAPQITDNGPRLGVYLKKGITGVGTVTWYDPDSGKFGTLGHGVNDAQGKLVRMQEGTAYKATVLSVKKGKIGTPGQLMGALDSESPLGSLSSNTSKGVFGIIRNGWPGQALPVASVGDIHTGDAVIRSAVDNNTVREYSVKILKIYPSSRSDSRNMLLKITDPELLQTTGGIVQGMSGSPIIQDGKLIGAVTHVLVNDPTTGYGIFIENMLDAAA